MLVARAVRNLIVPPGVTVPVEMAPGRVFHMLMVQSGVLKMPVARRKMAQPMMDGGLRAGGAEQRGSANAETKEGTARSRPKTFCPHAAQIFIHPKLPRSHVAMCYGYRWNADSATQICGKITTAQEKSYLCQWKTTGL
jgi:hypothetical protein